MHEKITNSKKNNHANEDGRSVIQNSVGVLTDSMDGQWDYQVADSVDSCTYCRQFRKWYSLYKVVATVTQ